MNKIIRFLQNVFLSDKFTLFLRLTLILAIVEWIFSFSLFNVFISLLALILTYTHIEIEKRYNIVIPRGFQVLIIIFVYCSLFLWEIHSFYIKYPWWDTLLHWFSWLALWFVWFLILYVFYKSWKFKAPIFLIAVFSFSFWMALWAIWEIFEFLVDESLGMNMQKARWLEIVYWHFDTRLWVMDTMQDLIIDAVWTLIASTSWYFYLKKGDMKWISGLIASFEKANKSLFKN